MKLGLANSPVKPALLSALGSLMACAIFLVPLRRMHQSHMFGGYVALCLVVFAGGAIFSLKFVSELKNGIENQRWTEAQVEPLRAHLESHYYTALSLALFVAFILFEFIFRRRFGGLGWGCFVVSQNISQLRIALKRPRSSTPSIDWHSFGPLHSDHWGEH